MGFVSASTLHNKEPSWRTSLLCSDPFFFFLMNCYARTLCITLSTMPHKSNKESQVFLERRKTTLFLEQQEIEVGSTFFFFFFVRRIYNRCPILLHRQKRKTFCGCWILWKLKWCSTFWLLSSCYYCLRNDQNSRFPYV